MAFTVEQFRQEVRREFLEACTVEERLMGLPPEELARRLSPEERVRGLSVEDILKGLALTDALSGVPAALRQQLQELLLAARTPQDPPYVADETSAPIRGRCPPNLPPGSSLPGPY